MIETVKWFNANKGYRFIAPDNGGADIFVHVSDVRKSQMQELHEGQRLSFELGNARNGKVCATRLAIL